MSLKIVSLPHFSKELKRLHKRYKSIGKDLQKLQKTLLKNPEAGIRITHNCYKIRVANSSVPTGKSGGFRIIYYYLDKQQNIFLLSIYSKSDMDTIDDKKIISILGEAGLE